MASPLDGLLSTLGPSAPDLAGSLDAMDSSCADPREWADAVSLVVADLEALAAQLSETPVDGQVVGDPVFDVTARVLQQQGCQAANPSTEQPADLTAGLEAAARLAAAYERFYMAALPDSRATPLWFDSDQSFHFGWIYDDQLADVDLALVGSSTIKRDIDPEALGEGLDLVVGNLAMRAASVEVTDLWLDESLPRTQPEIVVWGVSGIDVYPGCELDVRRRPYRRSTTTRQEVFVGVPWLADQPWPDRVLAIKDGSPTFTTPSLDIALEEWIPGSRGRGLAKPGFNENAWQFLMDRYTEPFREAEVCEERKATLESSIRRLVTDGHQVILLGLPLEPRLVAEHPGGQAGLAAAVDDFVAGAVDAGATYVDASDLSAPEDFNDATHLNPEGQRRFTTALVALLGQELDQ